MKSCRFRSISEAYNIHKPRVNKSSQSLPHLTNRIRILESHSESVLSPRTCFQIRSLEHHMSIQASAVEVFLELSFLEILFSNPR